MSDPRAVVNAQGGAGLFMENLALAYDSTQDTLAHMNAVRDNLKIVRANLHERAIRHDESKLQSPEREIFDEFTPKLKGSTYGSEEYKGFLAAMKPALDHHYAANSHHPEHYGYQKCPKCDQVYPLKTFSGMCVQCHCPLDTVASNVSGMSLLDIIEMLCDWKAATMRHADGDILRSIEINQKRFGYSDEMRQILLNTVAELGFG